DKTWPQSIADVLTQQIREPQEELQLRDTIPLLTAIDDDVSMAVRQQYEENPYPRWVHAATPAPNPPAIDEHLRSLFPSAPLRPLRNANDHTRDLDVLIAGCGTGQHPIEVAQRWKGLRLLAVDLSLASLCCAKRKTPKSLAHRIEYAQGDILKLGSIDRTFDVIDSSGVLHHLADQFSAWRTLLKLLRSGGLMKLGLYSEVARSDIIAARAFIAERGYRPQLEDI